VLELFASQVAIAIHNANLYAEVRRLAITDELTGLFNQRGMVEVGQREVDRAQRLERSLVAMMIDLDHFKRVNDTYGHPVGNEVLAELAGRIKLSLRGFDVVCRYGGEEFLVLAVESGLESGVQIAERLRHAVEASPFSTTAGGLKITISLGVAALQPENDTLAGLIDRADQALLKAKAAGRNRVVADSH
jgi:diguanylate cyclase (GGDEF)-like protein